MQTESCNVGDDVAGLGDILRFVVIDTDCELEKKTKVKV